MRGRLGSVRAARQLLRSGGSSTLCDGAASPGLHRALVSAAHNFLRASTDTTSTGINSTGIASTDISAAQGSAATPSRNQPSSHLQAGTSQEQPITSTVTSSSSAVHCKGPYGPSQPKPWPLPSHSFGLPPPEPRCTTGAPPASRAPPTPAQQGPSRPFQDTSGVPWCGETKSAMPSFTQARGSAVTQPGASRTVAVSLSLAGSLAGSGWPGYGGVRGSLQCELGAIRIVTSCTVTNRTVTSSTWTSRTVTNSGTGTRLSGQVMGGVPAWRLQGQRLMSITESEDARIGAKKAASPKKPFARTVEPRTPKVSGVAFPDGNLLHGDQFTPEASKPQAALMAGDQDQGGLERTSRLGIGVGVGMGPIPEVWGRVHSIESFSAVDGPGIRSVVFLQGCLRRCVFCSNPDTWSSLAKCKRLSSKDICRRLRRNLGYYEGGGGVTLSGGEPMMQPLFCGAVFKEAHALGVTTCLDTAGYGHAQDWAEVLPHTDTVMLCTKAMDPKLYFQMVEVKQKVMLDFAKAVADYGVPLVIRFVLVPGITDTREEVEALVEWAKQQPTLVGMEMLPYHRLGVNKWEEMGLKYPLEGMEPPPKEQVEHWKQYIQSEGIKVIL